MFGITALTTKRLVTDGALALAAQHMLRRGLRRSRLRKAREALDRKINKASEDSFPASDPPAWVGSMVGPSSDPDPF
jgi:hypothetical protein